ncbi:MAG: hypothetical protein QXQ46_03635 [Thermoplasmatales archaeon]
MVYYPKAVMKKEKCLLIMDRGFESEDNIKLMDTARHDYIIGLRSSHKFVKELKRKTDFSTGNHETIEENGQIIKLVKVTKNIYGKRRTVILYFSQKVADDQKALREFRIEGALKRLGNQNELSMKKAAEVTKLVKKYVILEQKGKEVVWHIDKVAVNRAEMNDGKFCIVTNLNTTAKDIFHTYFSKDKIEKGFMHMKQDANLQPLYKRLADNVIVDVFLCRVAYLLLRVVERLAQQEKIDKNWSELSFKAEGIRIVELRNLCGGNATFQMITNNEMQRIISDKMKLANQTPVITTNGKTSSET